MKHENPADRKIEIWLGRIFLVVVSIGTICVLVELTARLATPHPHLKDTLWLLNEPFHTPKPYVMATALPDCDGNNALGYRGPLPTANKPSNEFRIFVLGGSTVYFGNPSLPEALQNLLTERGMTTVKVFNFGITSSVSRQELVRLLLDIGGYQPDLILSYNGYNDFFRGLDPRINYPHRFALMEANPILTWNVRDYDWAAALGFGSQFIRNHFGEQMLERLTKNQWVEQSFNPQEDLPRRLDAYFQNLRWTAQLAKTLGAEFVPVFQPSLAFKKRLSPEEKLLSTERLAANFHEELLSRASAFRSELELQDFTSVFDDQTQQIFVDSVHVTDPANLILAEHLFKLLAPKIQESRRHPKIKSSFAASLLPETHFVHSPNPELRRCPKTAEFLQNH